MPTQADLATIEAAFAQQYGLDLNGIRSDAKQFTALIASNAPDPQSVKGACYTYDGAQAIVPDLETIVFSDVPQDELIGVQRVELNFDETSQYLQACLKIRQQYGEVARLRNDTRFKGEEFVRLDAVHLDEVEAGLYKLAWLEAADEKIALETALARATEQEALCDEMLRADAKDHRYSAVLSDGALDLNAKQNGAITRNVVTRDYDDMERTAIATNAHRNNIEQASWRHVLAGANSNVAQVQAKLRIAKRKEDYFRKDVDFRTQRAAISRQLAWLQIYEHCRIGSELNYSEKLQRLKALFDQNVRCLVERVRALDRGLSEIYGLAVPFSAPDVGGMIDEIAIWLVHAGNALSKFKRTQRTTISSIWSEKLIPGDSKVTGFDVFNGSFTVSDADLPAPKAKLRGIGFEFTGDNRRPMTVRVTPPQGAIIAGGSEWLTVGRVCPASVFDLKPQHSDALWNGGPTGVWGVRGAFDKSAGDVSGLVMHLWVISD
ncbi:MAG: hypothetical protein J0H91_20815 [Rhodospirillales bacterium]|nr:hypothetical protein [Rhodospirillales bacterium]